jgi:hypothetical protein
MRGSGHGGLDDVYSSIDGIIYNWLTDSVGWDGLNNPVSAVFNETIWLIDGNALIPQTWYSFDGSSWTLGTGAPVWKNNVFGYKVAVFENKMWLIGYESGNGFNVWNTSDGFDWEFVVNIDSFGTTLSDMVAYDGKLIFFVGPDVYYSDDGTNWENTSINQLAEINNYTVESFAGKLWIVAAGDHFFYSEDGITWQEDSGVIFPWGGDIDDQLSFVFDNKLWVLGGKAAGLSNTNIWSFTNYADQ